MNGVGYLDSSTGTSPVLANANGDEVGRTLYDGFGAVLTTTLPLTLTGALLDAASAGSANTDAATGLVHLGGGRWYDPALGRPLQPNPMGGPPTLPQALNRYAATPVGQPGVAAAEYQRSASTQVSLQQYLLNTTIDESIEGALGIGVDEFVGTSGYLTLKANDAVLGRAGYQGLFKRTASLGRGKGALYESVPVIPMGSRRYQVTGGELVIDLNHLESKVKTSQWGVDYPGGKAFTATGAFGRAFKSELIVELAFSVFELHEPWANPYFDTGQRLTQNTVTMAGALTSAAAGAGAAIGVEALWAAVFAVDPPVGVVIGVGIGVGVGVNYLWEYAIQPGVSWIAVNVVGTNDPYLEIRRLAPLGNVN